MSHAEQQLPERSQKLVKQIDKTQDRLGSLISRMEVMEKRGLLNEAGRARLDTVRELHSNLGKIRESVASTGALSASHEEMKRDINSWQSAAKYAGMETFEKVVTLGGLINPMGIKGGSKELMERQFDSLERAGSALTDFEISITKMVSNIDSMATALSNGDMEGFQKAAARYESGAKQMMRDADNMATAVGALGEQREYFEGASKVAKGFFVDAAVVVATAGALSAVAKIGKVQNLMKAAKAEAEMGKAFYQSTAGVAAKAVPRSVEAAMALAGTYVKEGEISVSDAALIVGVSFIPKMGVELGVPKKSITFAKSVEDMLEKVQAGKMRMKLVAEYVRNNAPADIALLGRKLASEQGGYVTIPSSNEIHKSVVKLYGAVKEHASMAYAEAPGKMYAATKLAKARAPKSMGKYVREVISDTSRGQARSTEEEFKVKKS